MFQRAFQTLIQAQMIMGENKVAEIAVLTKHLGDISFTTDNIMGVKIPKVNSEHISFKDTVFYSFTDTCAKFDDAQLHFRKVMLKLVTLADLEGGIKSLAVEIEKTKRRVNVLENTLIPKLYATRKYIEMQLEEREREDFFRRKRIKALMEKKKS
jgi:V/A-type H+-transporting ATPase subunit D